MPHRGSLLDKLSRYEPLNASDAAAAKRLLEFVRGNERCFERGHAPGHVTGSAWVTNAAGDQVLLTHHKKLNRWLQLGGHADGEPDVLAVALREAEEESGLDDVRALSSEIFDLDVHWIPDRPSEPGHFHYDVRFAFVSDGGGPVTGSDESNDVAWVRIEDLERFAPEAEMMRMREKWRRWRKNNEPS